MNDGLEKGFIKTVGGQLLTAYYGNVDYVSLETQILLNKCWWIW